MLAAITLLRSVVSVGEARAQAQSVRQDFLSAQRLSLPIRIEVCPLHWWNRCPEGQTQIDYVLFKCIFFLFPALRPFPQRRQMAIVSVDCILSEVLCRACVGICDSTQMKSEVIFFPSWGCSRSSAR